MEVEEDMRKRKKERGGERTNHKPSPNTMVQSPFHPLNLNPSTFQPSNHHLRNLRTAFIRILILIIMFRKSVEIINQISLLGGIDSDFGWAVLPVGREDEHGFGLDFCGDFEADRS